VVVRWWSLFR